jgi:molybdopterin molybdotransferase
MISVAEADRLLARFRDLWPAETVPLHEAAGRILREDIRADRSYPAQDRSYMDGIAIAFGDWERGARDFAVAGLARAGEPRQALERAGACIEIMTGAAIPVGADTVIPYEDFATVDGVARVRDDVETRRGRSVHVRGSDCVAGAVLVPAGVRLHAAHVAVAASVGEALFFAAFSGIAARVSAISFSVLSIVMPLMGLRSAINCSCICLATRTPRHQVIQNIWF